MLDGSLVDLEIRGHTIVKVGEINAPGRDIEGMWLVPAFIDSHVHLSLFPGAEDLAKAGVAGVVDLASPRAGSKRNAGKLFMKDSGPMITAERGYPTQAWGRNGYGRECASEKAAVKAVDQLLEAGAEVIKIPIGPNGLPLSWAKKAIARAHKKKTKVAVHALGGDHAAEAAAVEADVLAHTPIEPMNEESLDAWGERAVITTLAAFGGGEAAQRNLQGLRDRGAVILYGTDLGNLQYAGIHPDEIGLLLEAGFDGAAIIEAGTRAPARFWGFKYLGEIAPGMAASFLLVEDNPLEDPMALTRPAHVYIDGIRMK